MRSYRRGRDIPGWVAGIIVALCPILLMGAYIPGTMVGSNNLSEVTNTSTARSNLGLGSISTQAANAVAITGGTIDGTTVGATTRSSVRGTTGDFSGILTLG